MICSRAALTFVLTFAATPFYQVSRVNTSVAKEFSMTMHASILDKNLTGKHLKALDNILPLQPPFHQVSKTGTTLVREASTAMHASILCENLTENIEKKTLDRMCTGSHQ